MFRGVLGIAVHQCKPNDPEAKGMVERNNSYFETSFLPGRSFTSPGDFTEQMSQWISARANRRHHRALGCRPIQRWEADRAAMLALPPVAPVIGWRASVRLPRDYYVRLDSNDYSVHPSVIGRRVEVVADLARVVVTCGGRVVADHARCWADHQTITDPDHAAAAAAMRQSRSQTAGPQVADEVQQRPLSDYDTVFGLTEAVA